MKKIIPLALVLIFTGCGGGSTSGSSMPVTVAPTVLITLSSTKAFVGETVKVIWTSTNATSCTGTDGLSGVQPTNGAKEIKPTAGGQVKYSLSCTGAGGSGFNTQTLIVPIPVQQTSYLNFKNNGIGKTKLPEYTHAMTYGDFFQDGTVSLMTSPVIADMNNPTDFNKIGKVKFYKNINSIWIDRTSEILKNDAGCVWPRKAVSADFNGDKKPDIFLACHGFDAVGYNGEKQVLFLSQPDGIYKRTILDIYCYCHGATAADFKGDGFADLVITDTAGNYRQPMYLHNNKNGTFTATKDELHTMLASVKHPDGSVFYSRGIYGAEFIDINGDGSPDLYLGGGDINWDGGTEATGSLGAWTPKVFLNSGTNTFGGNYLSLPIDTAYVGSLDVILEGDIIWTLKVDYQKPQFKVQKYDWKNKVELNPIFIPNNGIFWIVKDSVQGIVTAG